MALPTVRDARYLGAGIQEAFWPGEMAGEVEVGDFVTPQQSNVLRLYAEAIGETWKSLPVYEGLFYPFGDESLVDTDDQRSIR